MTHMAEPSRMSSELARHHQLHGVQPVLTVADLPAAVRYFSEVLGFDVDFVYGDPPAHARVKIGDGTQGQPIYIHLSLPNEDEAGRLPTGELRIHVGHDVDGLCEVYRARGAEVVQEPTSQAWGLREFLLREPHGHCLRFCAESGAALDEPASDG